MAAGIVHILKLIEIDEQQRARALFDRYVVDFLLQFIDQSSPVEKPGQHIVIGQLQ